MGKVFGHALSLSCDHCCSRPGASVCKDLPSHPPGHVTRRSNQSISKDINPEYSLEGPTLELKLQYFGHLMERTDSFPNAGKD